MIPSVWFEPRPKRCQVWVLSLPNNIVEIDTRKYWVDETSQTTQADSQIKVPIKAGFSPTEPRIQEKIPPRAALNEAPYSANIIADGRKNKMAVTIYQIILA